MEEAVETPLVIRVSRRPIVLSHALHAHPDGLGGGPQLSAMVRLGFHLGRLSNFGRTVTDDVFWKSALNTVYYSLGVVPGGLAIALFRLSDFSSASAVRVGV